MIFCYNVFSAKTVCAPIPLRTWLRGTGPTMTQRNWGNYDSEELGQLQLRVTGPTITQRNWANYHSEELSQTWSRSEPSEKWFWVGDRSLTQISLMWDSQCFSLCHRERSRERKTKVFLKILRCETVGASHTSLWPFTRLFVCLFVFVTVQLVYFLVIFGAAHHKNSLSPFYCFYCKTARSDSQTAHSPLRCKEIWLSSVKKRQIDQNREHLNR